MATRLFPKVADQLRRKKDHGRAAALLIAGHSHLAEGGADSLTAFVQKFITKAQLRRAVKAPLGEESGRTRTKREGRAGRVHLFHTKKIPLAESASRTKTRFE